jgi:hypothetical protein
MAPRYRSNGIDLSFLESPLLITESRERYLCLRTQLEREIEPSGIVEKILFADILGHVWEVIRLRRCRDFVINLAHQPALSNILEQLCGSPQNDRDCKARMALERDWFCKPEARRKVAELLAEFGLDEGVIEAEAIRRKLPELETLDKLMASQQARLNRAFRTLSDYREEFATRARKAVDRVTGGPLPLQIDVLSHQQTGVENEQ